MKSISSNPFSSYLNKMPSMRFYCKTITPHFLNSEFLLKNQRLDSHYRRALNSHEKDCNLMANWSVNSPHQTQKCDWSTLLVAKSFFGFPSSSRKLHRALYSLSVCPLKQTSGTTVFTNLASMGYFCDPKYSIPFNCTTEEFTQTCTKMNENHDSLTSRIRSFFPRFISDSDICLAVNNYVFDTFQLKLEEKMRTVSAQTHAVFFIAIHGLENELSRPKVWHSFTLEVFPRGIRMYSSWYAKREMQIEELKDEKVAVFLDDLRNIVICKNKLSESRTDLVEKCFGIKDTLYPQYLYQNYQRIPILYGRTFTYLYEDVPF
jgi:hypothetical protein